MSDLDYQFLAASVELEALEMQNTLESERAKAIKIQLLQQQKISKQQRLFLAGLSLALAITSGLGILIFWQYRQAIISEIKALASSSQGLFGSNQQLDAMVAAMKAKRRLQSVGGVDLTLPTHGMRGILASATLLALAGLSTNRGRGCISTSVTSGLPTRSYAAN